MLFHINLYISFVLGLNNILLLFFNFLQFLQLYNFLILANLLLFSNLLISNISLNLFFLLSFLKLTFITYISLLESTTLIFYAWDMKIISTGGANLHLCLFSWSLTKLAFKYSLFNFFGFIWSIMEVPMILLREFLLCYYFLRFSIRAGNLNNLF